jgi:hypothetical protein
MQSSFCQPSLFEKNLPQSLSDSLWKDLCIAYFDVCKHKKKKQSVLEFDQHWELNLRQLHQELVS